MSHFHIPRRDNPEQELQIRAAALFRACLMPEVIATAFPAGGGGKVRGTFLKAMGLLPGCGDHLLMWSEYNSAFARQEDPLGSYPCLLWIEFKSKIGRQSPEQKIFEQRCKAIGHGYALCRSIDDVIAALVTYQVPHKRISPQPLIAVTVTAL